MKLFLKEVTKTQGSLAIYGESHIRKALEMGIVEILLLSEDLRRYRIKLSCSSCDYSEWQTISEDDLEDFEPPMCTKCDNSSVMNIEEKIDLIDELSDFAEKTSCNVEIISSGSEEGDSLFSAFDGIAGILRYSVDF